jgi:hypothetical protein
MTSVFVSHSSEDNYFVDFLIELLKFHRVDVWVDRRNLEAGSTFTSDIERALATCESMVVVISQHSSRSPWVTREIAHFKAQNSSRLVIPLMLDAKADPDKIYEGLGLVTQLRCYESLLDSLRELLRLLGRALFPPLENRKIPDRRSESRRQQSTDRRKASMDKRLRVGLVRYVEGSGRNLLEPMHRWRDVARLAQLLASEDSPLKSFNYADHRTGEGVVLDFPKLQSMALKSWRSKFEQEPASSAANILQEWGVETGQALLPSEVEDDMTGAAYIVDDIVDYIINEFAITPNERRSGERRDGPPRRKGQDK